MGMATVIKEDKPGIEERYLTATNTSDLTFDAARSSQADVIGAAGMVRNRLGMALWHLQSAWDKADKPAKRSAAEIAKRAAEIPDKKGRPDLKRAQAEALVWHAGAMRALAQSMPGRSAALGLLKEWATFYGVDHDLLSPALFHFLAPRCPVCEGTRRVHHGYGKPGATEKTCDHCKGIGDWPRPLGADRVHEHMRKCFQRAKSDMVGALYG